MAARLYARAGTAAEGGRCGRACVSTRFTRGRYATDASHYQIMPLGVVAPRTIEEAESRDRDLPRRGRAGDGARRRHVAGRPDGQPIAHRRLLEASQPVVSISMPPAGAAWSSPASCSMNSIARSSRRPVVSGRYLDRVARHHRRHGRQQFLRRPLAALRQYARERAVDRRRAAPTAPRAHFGRIGDGRRRRAATRWCAICSPSPRARPTRSSGASRKCSAASAAIISMRWCPAATTSISRISWSARKARWRSRPRSS